MVVSVSKVFGGGSLVEFKQEGGARCAPWLGVWLDTHSRGASAFDTARQSTIPSSSHDSLFPGCFVSISISFVVCYFYCSPAFLPLDKMGGM